MPIEVCLANCEMCNHVDEIITLQNKIKELEEKNKKLIEWFGIFKTLNECNIKLIDENILK